MTELLELRPEVQAFAKEMERQLRENDNKPGWKDSNVWCLKGRMEEELRELNEAIHIEHFAGPSYRVKISPEEARKAVVHEAVDCANFAMMIADLYGLLEVKNDGQKEHLADP